MIWRVCPTKLRNVWSAVLALLLPKPFLRDLIEPTAQHWRVLAFGNPNLCRDQTVCPRIRDVVSEANRDILLCRVVIDAFGRYRVERNARVHLQRRPRSQTGRDLLWKHVRVARRLVHLLGHFPGNLMVTVTVARAAHERRRD